MATTTREPAAGAAVFASLLVGVDGSPAARAATVQAARLVAPGGSLELVTAVYLVEAGLCHWSDEETAAALEREGGPALAEAAEAAGRDVDRRLVNGAPLPALLAEAERISASLVCVGSHGHSRMSELLIGGVSGPLLHDAPCSVLVARPTAGSATFPRSVVVGLDGSLPSLHAYAVAQYLAARFDVPLRAVLARHGDVDVVHAELHAPGLEIVDDSPVGALVEAGATADLLVVGSRGLHGMHSFGSVSERVAHKARASVLVVRSHRPAGDP